ncbi:MAG: HIT family protein [Crocinitomicaceae bacterium]
MSTIFTKIVNREIPAYIIHEDQNHLAFLDVNPIKFGHTLVIPKIETDYIFDLDSERFQALFAFSREVAILLRNVIPCKKIGVTVIGLEVPHAHIHLIPINSLNDMNFTNEKLRLNSDEAEHLVKKIKNIH